ncbi:MAG: PPC domain-containing protein, partial [Gemmataceae bacterium]
YPTVDEKEPNNEFANPQKIPMNVTVQGVVDSEDVDYFAVEGKKGQRLSVEIEAMRLANTLFDPAIAILDSKRFELASSDDTPLLGQDSLASVVLPADGTYIIQVRESAYQGNGGCGYRLHVGNFPRPLGAFPAGGKAGEEVEITFLGDPAGPFKQKVKMPGQVMDRYSFHPGEANQLCPSSIPLRVSNVGNTLEVEPNDTPDKATPGTFPTAFNGVIEKAGDVDNFRFKGKKGETYDVHCYARRLGSPLDPVMTLSVLGGGAIASSDDAIGPDSYFRITFPEDREYMLTITDHLGKGGAAFFYRVEFLLATPIATVSIPKVNIFSQERQTLSIPRGGRMATIFSVGRANFGGEMSVGLTGLPQGITPVSENLQGNLDTVPVVFEAGANAPVAGGLVTFALKHVDPKHPPVESAFAQTVELVTGGPGQSVYWKKDVNRMAIAVVEESPYSIEVVEPKVPLVQNGSMQLKIAAKRKPGFTAAITVYPLFNPPGVSSASAVTIPANANEVLMPLNAAGNAQARKWKTAFIAVSDAGKGPIWVSSQLATIEVAPPILAITMDRAMVEQGKQTELFCKVQVLSPFAGEAVVKLLGLPTKVTTPDIKITKDAKDCA